MTYLSRYRDSIRIVPERDTREGLWECQMGAYWALQSHFTAYDEGKPAIVSLPTGSGKTALMMVMAFARDAERVLVISPSRVVRNQTATRFDELLDLQRAGILQGDLAGDNPEYPSVNEVTGHVSVDQWGTETEGYDVVVACPNSISPDFENDQTEISLPPEDKFDLVLVDEGHHATAPAWQTILGHLDGVERILFTATAFRRDRESLPGRLAYHYPVDKAIESGIYQELEYREIEGESDDGDADSLCQEVATVLDEIRDTEESPNSESSSGLQPALLARTNKKKRADRLVNKYDEVGLSVLSVHSGKTNKQNKEAIQALKSGEVDGLVGVNSLAEGLDADHLQVAALHHLPRSFPFTYQLLGRIARPSSAADRAVVIGNPDFTATGNMREAVRRLYLENSAWGTLVPDLVDKFVTREDESDSSSLNLDQGFDEAELTPHRSLRVYDAEDFDGWESELPDMSLGTLSPLSCTTDTDGFLGFISERIEEPSWARGTHLEYSRYDLHLYYHPSDASILFEFSTSEEIAKRLRDKICPSVESYISGRRLTQLLRTNNDISYHITGLANSALPSGQLPAYKTFLGDDVQGAVKPSDGRTYTTGHAFAKLDEETTRGISGGNGRVWEQGSVSIGEFKGWCEEIYEVIADDSELTGAQGLEFLNNLEPIDEFDTAPLVATQNPKLIPKRITYISSSGSSQDLDTIDLEVARFEASNPSALDFVVHLKTEQGVISLDATYDVASNVWSGGISDVTFQYESSGRPDRLSGEDFFSAFPPFIYTNGGSVVIGGEQRTVEPTYENLQEVIEDTNPVDWSTCAISEEEPPDLSSDNDPHEIGLWSEDRADNSVHQRLVWYLQNQADEQVLFYDHKSGEVADIVQFLPDEEPTVANPTIRFYHCKGFSDGSETTASLDEIKDVQQQVLRNTTFIMNTRLPGRIEYRASGGSLQHFIEGQSLFTDLTSTFRPGEWEYEVYIVHPGLDPSVNPNPGVEGERTDSNVNTLLCVCYEWIQDAGASFHIWGGT